MSSTLPSAGYGSSSIAAAPSDLNLPSTANCTHATSKTSNEDEQVDAAAHLDQPITYEEPYDRDHGLEYTKAQKWSIVILTSTAGVFSPLTANIYFPAIPAMAEAFQTSIQRINLSVTAYIVLQGVAPILWGTLADAYGRRPCMIACLLFLSLSCVAIALVPAPGGFWLMVLLRCLQAAGSASTFPIGAGVLADITRPEERGGMMGVYTLGLAGPAIGPVLSGAIAQAFGWRSIFWSLALASAIALVIVLLLLPETLPSIVTSSEQGRSVKLVYRPWIPAFTKKRRKPSPTSSQPTRRPIEQLQQSTPAPSPLPPQPLSPPLQTQPKKARNPLHLLASPSSLLLLSFNGVLMAAFYAISATLTPLHKETYPFLSIAEIGYCFLAFGGAMVLGTRGVGWVLDWEFAKAVRNSGDDGVCTSGIARVRLAWSIPVLCAFAVCCAGYGWVIEAGVHLAVPLLMLVVFGFAFIWLLIATQTFLVDLAPSQGSSVTALNNLARCITGAIFVSVIQVIVDSLGAGWTFVMTSGILVLGGVMLWCVRRIRVDP